MVDLCLEAQGRRLERVLRGKAEVQVENSTLWIVSDSFLALAALSRELAREATNLIR